MYVYECSICMFACMIKENIRELLITELSLQPNKSFLKKKIDIFFIYISNVMPFPGFPSENPLSLPPLHCSPTHSLPLTGPSIPLHWCLEPSQGLGPLLPLTTNEAILCYIESSFPPCVFFGWWFSPCEFWGKWLVHIVGPTKGLQTPSDT